MKEVKILDQYPKIKEFIYQNTPLNIERIESRWRKENFLLRIFCVNGIYVFKKIGEGDAKEEISRVNVLRLEYPEIIPSIHLVEDDSYLMGNIEGKSFFELDEKQKLEKINKGGEILNNSWKNKNSQIIDISEKIRNSFARYRKKSAKFFLENELQTTNFELFKKAPNISSHNDLNAANLLYDGGIKLIDPSEEGYNDIARDVGRYCASVFFNQYDYFGNNKKFSLDLAHAFLCNFPIELIERTKYFVGESFLSFLNFHTHSTDKNVLKKLAMNILTKDKPILNSLEESL